MFIRGGGMVHWAELTGDPESAVRVNALWAVKNSLFKSTTSENRVVLGVLGWGSLNRYIFYELPTTVFNPGILGY
jgi:hypothetical protein